MNWIMKVAASFGALCVSISIAAFATESYAPGLGEIMAATQMRHAKLWFAGRAGNWDLANYELDELHEGFGDVLAYQPILKSGARAADLLPRLVELPLADLKQAVARRDRTAFIGAFDRLTAACNECHRGAGIAFIHIIRPNSQIYSNQAFR